MIRLTGEVVSGFGVAGSNLKQLHSMIATRTGLPGIEPGTLNVQISQSYLVKPDAALSAREYNGSEVILLQRAAINGVAAIVMRPHTHELLGGFGHGTTTLELMAPYRFRDRFGFENGSTVTVELEGNDQWWASALRAI